MSGLSQIAVALVFLKAWAFPADSRAACPTPDPTILEKSPSRVVLAWELPCGDLLSDPEGPELPEHAAYVAWVASQVDPDPFSLLRRQRERFLRPFPDEIPKFDLILSGRLGRIAPIAALEKLLFVEHLRHFSPIDRMTEFGAYVLRRGEAARIYFISNDQGGVPMSLVEDRVQADLATGEWMLFTHIHSHPFAFGNPSGDIAGTLIPSGARALGYGDVHYYHERVRPRGARDVRITNGIDTIVIGASELELLP